MPTLLKISLQELWRSRSRLFFPALCLLVAVSGLYILRSLQTQIEEKISEEGRVQMGADIEVEFHSIIPESDLDLVRSILPAGSLLAANIEFNTMLQIPAKNSGRYVRLAAIDSGYPFYGAYDLKGVKSFAELNSKESQILMPQDLVEELGISLNERLKIGEQDFRLAGIVESGTGGLSGFVSFAPKVWIHRRHLDKTQLLDKPGRIDYEYVIKLPLGESALMVAEKIKTSLDNDQYDVDAYNGSDRGFQRFFTQISLFGQLIAIAALLLAGVTIYGCFQNWFFDRRYFIAILKSLGARQTQIFVILFSSLIVFSVLTSFLAILVGYSASLFVQPLVAEILNFNLPLQTSVFNLFSTFFIGALFPILFGVLAFTETANYKSLLLLRTAIPKFQFTKNRAFWLSVLVAVIFGLNALILESLLRSIYVTGSLVLLFGIGCGINLYLLRLLGWLMKDFVPLVIRYPLRSLLREKWITVVSANLFFILSLILSTMVAMEESLRRQFMVDESVSQTSLFILDVGEREKQSIDESFLHLEGASLNWAPWVQVKWKSVNTKPISEIEDEDGRLRSEYLVTETLEPAPQDRIIAGQFWSGSYKLTGLPEVSLTKRMADRYKARIGDKLGFELYGIAFYAILTNIRQVRWTDFQPGFRVVFQKGIFEGAPFSYLAAIETESLSSRVEARQLLNKKFPSVSMIDVAPIKKDLVRVMGDLQSALMAMLGLLFLIAAVLMFVLVQEKISSRKVEYAMLRCLGAKASWLKKTLWVELLVLSCVPTIIGVAAGTWANHHLLFYFLNLYDSAYFGIQTYLPVIVFVFVTFAVGWGTRQVSSLHPRETIR